MNKYIALSLLGICIPSAYANAQDKMPEDHGSYLTLSVENDKFGNGTDHFYTSGVRATWFNDKTKAPDIAYKIAEQIPTFKVNKRTGTYYAIGQNLYTPDDIKIAYQPQDDRPWAAFLYGTIGLINLTDNGKNPMHIDEVELTLGVVGSPALGKPIQRFIHSHITDSPDPKGWDNQLDFEPGFTLSWQRRIPAAIMYETNLFNARIEPHISATIGNIRTHAGIGATAVLGSSKFQDTPQRVAPSIPGTGVFLEREDKINWQIFAGVEGRLVGRDIFLDGNTFSNSHSVDKNNLVGDLSAGAALSYGDYRLSYTLNYRTKEFRTQNDESIFGSLTLSKRF
ncbi:MAG: lipid A deacylase LpxR family protein [Alphaproteobacteria bacterium]